ncbi:MAG: diguanylate cyclase [Lachnospiraceae bacterium]|nr:diguanylate cyclase [Lachnospiraceae bacterium]
MKLPKKNGQIYLSLQAMNLIPLLILGLIITFVCYHTTASAMHAQVEEDLKNMTDAVMLAYDLLYPGDYHLEGTEAFELFKGDRAITFDYSIIDQIKADSQMEITIFYEDTRILTTICDEDGNRIIGSGANTLVIRDVLTTGQPHFYTKTTIFDNEYFSYYAPLRNSDKTIVGMVYAGKPCADVNAAVKSAVLPAMFITLGSIVVVIITSSSYTRKLTTSLQKIRVFLSKVSTGNLGAELDPGVLKRGDELSDMGYAAIYMQSALRTLVEQDTLTELNNRRYADKHLRQVQAHANLYGTPFVIAIGDIDFFKSVNDTYGHECGDLVLKRVAYLLKKHMTGKGFVARWGGEEFLFVYDNDDLDSAREQTEALLEEIRKQEIIYEEQSIHITMTFGLAEGGVNSHMRALLQTADNKLYYGKENGRNQVVI